MSRPRSTWTPADIANQTGRTFVVTGANSGLGLATTAALTARGATVIMACRNPEKVEEARAGLPAADRERAEFGALDLADLDSVAAFVDGLGDRRIDVLVNNAGLMNVPFSHTAQGYEMQFGVNVLGHFALTRGLVPLLTDRVVWLSSITQRFGRIHFDDLNYERRRYHGMAAYSQSKLACLLLSFEQQRRFLQSGSSLQSIAAHPGYTVTEIQRRSEGPVMDRFMALGNSIKGFGLTPDEGASSQLFAATEPDLPGGWFIGPDGRTELRGRPTPVAPSVRARDLASAAELWRRCEEMVSAPR